MMVLSVDINLFLKYKGRKSPLWYDCFNISLIEMIYWASRTQRTLSPFVFMVLSR